MSVNGLKCPGHKNISNSALLGTTGMNGLTLPMLRLLSSKEGKVSEKPSKSCHVGINGIALAEYCQMSTLVPGFQSFSVFWHYFVQGK